MPINATIPPPRSPALRLAHEAPAPHPRDRLIRIAQVLTITGLGRTSVYDLVKKGTFPRPITINRRCSAWSENAVLGWVQAQLKGGEA